MHLVYLVTPVGGSGWRTYGTRPGYYGSAAELAVQVADIARAEHLESGPITVHVWIHRGREERDQAPVPDSATVHRCAAPDLAPPEPQIRTKVTFTTVVVFLLTAWLIIQVVAPWLIAIYGMLFTPRLPIQPVPPTAP
ncbi:MULTISPECIES: hypothetical protein [Kitasatospora]|uniref:hypothetical protein n=1 Tax=Kitasatospora TaxID=2063 RepID=UPI000527E344|nr:MULTISPECIES: hypothetical protein [Kitasatospora]